MKLELELPEVLACCGEAANQCKTYHSVGISLQ